MMKKQKRKVSDITYLMFGITALSVFLVSIFIIESTNIICENYKAADFLRNVKAIPGNPENLFHTVLFCLGVLVASFLIREYLMPENIKITYLTISWISS